MMYRKKLFIFILFTNIFYYGCSFDDKTGFWKGDINKQISEIENKDEILRTQNYKQAIFSKEINSDIQINFDNPRENYSWMMQGKNLSNNSGNILYSGNLNKVFKKKIGKKKHSYSKINSTPIIVDKNIILSDDTGSIFLINQYGKIIWKKNIYKKIDKKIYKNLKYTYYKKNLYIADNIGLLYSLNISNGEINWIRNYGKFFRSAIKIKDDKIFLIDHENTLNCFSIFDGADIWKFETGTTFVKSQSNLGMAFNDNFVFFINSLGDLYKLDINYGTVNWSLSAPRNITSFDYDFFESSDLVINDGRIYYSSIFSKTFSIDSKSGFTYWEEDLSSNLNPIISGENIYVLTINGYLVTLNKKKGNVVRSIDIFKNNKIFKEDYPTGFMLGSSDFYITTSNGYFIKFSTSNNKIEFLKRMGKSFNVGPIIESSKLYLLTGKSELLVYN